MEKRTEFNNALKVAIKEKDEIATSTLRLIIAALKDRDIAARGNGHAEGISEKEILSLLQSMIKQRQESFSTYKDAGRMELAEREEKEITIIQGFLPAQMSDDEVGKVIEELIADMGVSDIRDMGKVMAELKANYAGQLDMGKASGLVKQKLAS